MEQGTNAPFAGDGERLPSQPPVGNEAEEALAALSESELGRDLFSNNPLTNHGTNGGENQPTEKPLAPALNWDNRKSGATATSGKGMARKTLPKTPKTKPPGRGNRKHDWPSISIEFIEGIPVEDEKRPDARDFLSLKDLAERHDISYQLVRSRAGKEQWTAKREQQALQVARERHKVRQKKMLDKSVDFDDDALKTADIGMKLITTRLGEIAQEVTRRQKIRAEALASIDAGLPVDKTDLYSAINYREMEGLASAASRFQEIAMKALGTDVQKHELSGPGGEQLDLGVTQVNIHAEITRDDPDRIAAVLSSMQDAGLWEGDIIGQIVEGDLLDEGEKE